MSEPLILALPSKGRLKEQTDAWLADCGFVVQAAGGARGYRASIDKLPGAQVILRFPPAESADQTASARTAAAQ